MSEKKSDMEKIKTIFYERDSIPYKSDAEFDVILEELLNDIKINTFGKLKKTIISFIKQNIEEVASLRKKFTDDKKCLKAELEDEEKEGILSDLKNYNANILEFFGYRFAFDVILEEIKKFDGTSKIHVSEKFANDYLKSDFVRKIRDMSFVESEKNTDTKLLDFLQSLTDKGEYTGKVILRESTSGRGWRLHETSWEGCQPDVRAAIKKYMEDSN